MTEEQRAARREEYARRAKAMIEEITAQLMAAMEKAKEERERWLREGRTTIGTKSGTTDAMSSAEASSSESVTNTGFYRVVRTGIHLFGITNGTVLGGLVTIPIEVGYDGGEILESVYVNAGSDSPTQQIAIPGLDITGIGTGLIQLTWDTSQVTNGTYTLYLGAQLGLETHVHSEPISVIVSNQVWFPDPYNEGGYFVEVQAQSIHANGTYHVDMYDDTDFNVIEVDGPTDSEGYITYQGVRGFLVQNYDPETGEQYPSRFYRVVVATAAGGGFAPLVESTAINTNFIWIEDAWPSNTWQNLYTQFAVAYQPIYGDPALGGGNAVALQSMVQVVYSAVEARPDPFQAAIRGYSQDPFELWSQLHYTWLLTDCRHEEVRNLYYFGHGAPEFIGQKRTNPPKYLSVSDFNVALNNYPKYPQYRSHPYRFVFLDGCKTADGNLPRAFGIPKQRIFEEFSGWVGAEMERAFRVSVSGAF